MASSRTNNRWFAHVVGSLFIALLLLLAVSGIYIRTTLAQPPTPSGEPIVASTEPYIEYHPNTILIKLKPGVALAAGEVAASGAALATNAESLSRLLGALGATLAAPVFGTADTVIAAQDGTGASAGLERIYRVQWTSSIPVEHAVAALAADAAVEYAEPDYIARPARTPNDAEYASQWALPKINAPAAWDVSTGDPGVVIAIVDSGVDTAHPDFAGRLWVNDDPPNGVDDDLNGKVDDTNGWNVLADNATLTDPNGHGSQVGGVAGAATDNGVGVAGMCWGCKLMFVNAMQANNAANYSDIAAAVQYAASNGAHVINLSLGGYADSAVLRDAIREAATTAVIVAGAGNDDSATPFYPAAYPEVLAVAATDADDKKAAFSNYGAWVDVSAPGKDIRTTTLGGYATDSGTSLSTAFVSGLAGLIKSRNPAWTAEQVKWQILNIAANIDALNPTRAGQLGSGRINAGSALATTPQARARVESYAIDGQANARPAPGQASQLVLNVRNLWLPGQSLQGTLASSDPYVSITDNAGAFGDIAPGQLGSNSGDPFGVTVSGSAPYNHALQFTLNLTGAGGYSLAVPFNIQVRSAIETLGNTIYTQNTTWTSDKTYVLAGTVIVNQGVALTIQPGTVIKGNPGKFIRVDGTLVARGTAEQPIVFTTNSITNATWSGLRFADTAVDASYDVDGNYVAGSVLQHVEVSYADVAANLSTRSPYIADSVFKNNGTSIQIGNNNNGGTPNIERCTFTNGGGISLNGGAPLVLENEFSGLSYGLSGSGNPSIRGNTFRNNTETGIIISGDPIIINNVFRNNTGSIGAVTIGSGSRPIIRDNVIVGNSSGIRGYGIQLVDIEHNLIANNTGIGSVMCPPNCDLGAALWLDIQESGYDQSSPALIYNPTHNEYLAAWNQQAGNNSVVKSQRLSGEGQPIGDEVEIPKLGPSYGIGFPQIAYQTTVDRYFVVWAGGAAGGIQGHFLDATGHVVGSTMIITTVMASTVKVGYQPSDNTFVIAYDAQKTVCCGQTIYVQRLTADGALIGGPIVVGADLGTSNLTLSDLTIDTANSTAFVVFHSSSPDMWGQRIYGARIEQVSQPVSSTVIAENPFGYTRRPAVAFGTGLNRFAVVWEQSRGWDEWNSPRTLMGRSVETDGTLTLSSTIVFSDSGQVSTPRISYGSASGDYMTAWVYGATSSTPSLHRLYVNKIDNNGNPVGSPVLVSVPAPASSYYGIQMGVPAIAYNSQNNEYLVAWADNRLGMTSNIFAQRLSATGQLLDNTWTPADETNPANNFRISQPRGVRYNTIIHNTGNGIQLGGQAAASVNIVNNNLFGNGTYDLYLSGGQAGTQNFTVNATDNFWNIDPSQIPNRIRDCTFDDNGCNTASSTVGKVAYSPSLAAPDQTAPAYVRSVTMDPNPVGLQRGTVTIDFSKPMSVTTLPVASFHDARRGTTQPFTIPVTAMAEDAMGHLWFATSQMAPGDSTLWMYDGRQWVTYTQSSGLGAGTIMTIYGANNGDVWVGHGCCGDAAISRLQGTVWTTYTKQVSPDVFFAEVTAIGEDGNGDIWFSNNPALGVVRFDGSLWRSYTTANGLADNQVGQIVRDGQGRVWFRTGYGGIGSPGGLSVFDGVDWRSYGVVDGLPIPMYLGSIFADSSGRVWVSVYNAMDPNTKSVAMFDGSNWSYFGSAESSNVLNAPIAGFAETSDGAVWMFTSWVSGNAIIYHEGNWSSVSGTGVSGMPVLFDGRDNLWHNSNGLKARWGGHDYVFTDGTWLSSTRFQAGYDFTAAIPPGYYLVEVDGAYGSDGMSADISTGDAFSVDFGAGVTLDPPVPPRVTAHTNGTLSHLSASWQSNSANVDQYRYAIGTTPGGRNIVGWTYLAGTSFARTDLNLIAGQVYYVTVQARNTSGLWSLDAVSNIVIGGQVTPPPVTPTLTPDPHVPPTATPTLTPDPFAPSTATPQPGGVSNLYLPNVRR